MLTNVQPTQPDIPDTELKWFVSELNEVLENRTRLDASKFNVEGKHARELIKQCGLKLKAIEGTDGIANTYHRPRFKRVFVNYSDYPIYQPSQIGDVYPRPHLFISDTTKTNIDALRVKKGQILLTCSGTIGNTTIALETLDDKIFSHDLIRINPKNKIDTGYIYAFLKTKTGKTLVNTNNYGAVVKHIEPSHLVNVPIPYPKESLRKQVHKLIISSFNLRDESNTLIDKARKLLINELKLPPLEKLLPKYFDETKDFKNYSVSLSRLDNRLDGSYHVPMVEAIIEHLKKHAGEVTTIQDPRISKEVVLPGRFKRVYVEEGQGAVFFGGKQIYELDPSNKKYLSLTHHAQRIKKELILEENRVLITCSGTIGRVIITPKHWEGWTANQHIIRVIPTNNEIAGYLYSWLSSKYGKVLITRHTYGAVVDEIDNKQVGQVQIPLLKNKKAQKQINNYVLEANQKRYEAYLKEQEAIRIVNHEVLKLPSDI